MSEWRGSVVIAWNEEGAHIMWRQVIRTGNPQQDQWMVEQARAHAAGQGLILHVTPLPQGGVEVQALPPGDDRAHAGQERRFQMTLKKHTGMLVIMQTQTIRVQGTLEQCEAAYRSAQLHNLLAGWWGLFSMLIMNWIALFSNMSAISQVRALARSQVR